MAFWQRLLITVLVMLVTSFIVAGSFAGLGASQEN
jgi:Na+-transporting NADH:ubiquinone oxidoreductase subunit NqrC